MKKFIISLIVFLLIPVTVYSAQFDSEEYNDTLSNYDLSFFEDTLDDSSYDMLKELGLDNFDYDAITSISFGDILNVFKNVLKEHSVSPVKSCFTVLLFVVLSCFIHSFRNDDSLSQTYSAVSALVITACVLSKLTSTITTCVASVSIAGDFIYAFVPVFCIIVASSGGITTSFSTNSMLLMLSQGLSFLSSNVFMPCINCFLALGICSSLRYELHLSKLVSSLKRIITTCISFVCGVFVSVLSLKTAVSSRADLLGLRSIRFAVNSVVPVIGSSISEGLLSIQAYSSLIKSSVGVVGIVAVCLVFLPALLEVVIWRIALSVCVIVSDLFGDNSVSSVLNAFREAMLLANVILILSLVTTVISIGILVASRGGA